MVRIHRDVADSGRDSVRAPRRADHEARGHIEAPRETRPPGRLSEIPPPRRGSPGGSPDRRSHLRGVGFARPERRMGDPEEGPRGDEAGHVGPPAADDSGSYPHVCSDRGGPWPRLDEGLMLEGIADAAGVDAESVRTAHMFLGDLGMVAEIALFEGAVGLRSRGLRLLAPMKPMLAEMAEDLDEVLAEHGGQTAVEFKLDGARIQIHRKGDVVRIFSRRLSDVTDSLPEIVAIAKSLPASEFLLEGEVVAVNADGKPLPFQDLMRRFRRVHGIAAAQEEIPLKLYLFDLLHVDGQTLIDAPYRARWESLERLVPSEYLTARRIVTHKQEIEPFLQAALVAGHEGLMAKALDSTYSVGKRGKKWFKIKPADLLDMAIVAAEWGSGRREGWLSNYWLAVRDESTGGFQMIGKTFKGLTDAEFETMTECLRGLATSEERWGFHVRPEVVVEVAYNEIQRSPHYPSGFALRFARIVRIRDDKGPDDVDTYARLKDLYKKQFERKGRSEEHTSELQSHHDLVCRLLLEKKKKKTST